MRIFGQLIKARIQNVTGAITAAAKGLLYYRTDQDKVYVDDASTALEMQLRRDLNSNFRADGPSTTGAAQLALCNNAANSGYEYNDAHIRDTKANITAMTRVAGRIYYATDENLYYGDNGSTLVSLPFGSGSITIVQKNSSGDQSISHATDTKVTFDATPLKDTNGLWNSANNRFIIDSAGDYDLSGMIEFNASSVANSSCRIYVYKNGSIHLRLSSEGEADNATATDLPISAILRDLAVSDYIEIYAFQRNDTSTARNINSGANVSYVALAKR